MVKDWSYNKHLSQFGKCLSSSENKKVWRSYCLFRLARFFKLRHFCIFLPNLIVYKLIAINITTIRLTFAIIFRFIVSTKPNSIFLGWYCRLGTPWNLQYWDNKYSYLTKFLDKLPIKVGKSKKNLNISYWLSFKSLLNYLDFFDLFANDIQEYHIAKKPNVFLIKSIFLQAGI